MSDVVFVKIGGAVATDKAKEKTLRPNVLGDLAEALKLALDEGDIRLVLGHGGGSFGHFPAMKYEVKKGVHPKWGFDGFQVTRGWMTELNGKVRATFASKGLKLFPVQPSSCLVADGGRIASFEIGPIEALVRFGKVPVVWGDAVLDRSQGFTIVSTEAILSVLAASLKPVRVLALTDVDGVYADFDRAEGKAPLPTLDPASFAELREKLGTTTGVDVTGGMVEKVEKLLALAAASPESEIRICNGLDPSSVRDAVLGRFQGGTLIRPAS